MSYYAIRRTVSELLDEPVDDPDNDDLDGGYEDHVVEHFYTEYEMYLAEEEEAKHSDWLDRLSMNEFGFHFVKETQLYYLKPATYKPGRESHLRSPV